MGYCKDYYISALFFRLFILLRRKGEGGIGLRVSITEEAKEWLRAKGGQLSVHRLKAKGC